MNIVLFLGCVCFAALAAAIWRHQLALRREAYIRSFALPKGLFEKLQKQHPHLNHKDCQLVAQGLRQFFLTHLKSGRQYVSMPSQAADDLWHEFILYTKHYHQFCGQAFGRFLHHTPAVVLGKGQQGNTGIRRCWHYACKEENINPRSPNRLPLLFALDGKLGIAGGFLYVPDCSGFRKQDEDSGAAYCGAELGAVAFSDSGAGSSCGGDSGGSSSFSDDCSDSGGGDSGGGDSGGSSCGGGGCGGGGD